MCLAAPKPQVYIGGKGAASPLGFPTPRGAASPRSHLGGRPRGEECLPSQVEASPFRVFPFPCAWALGGWCPWPIKARAPPTAHATVLDVVEQFPDLRTPLESSGTFWKLPGTIPKKP